MNVGHDAKNQAFEAVIDGKRSHLDYEIRTDGARREMLFTHTFVAPEHRGKGVAAALTEAGLKYARENGYEVVPLCSYAASYLKRRPQD